VWFGYFAHPLKRQPTAATWPSSRRTKIGQLSRVHERSVGTRKHSTRSGATPMREQIAPICRSAFSSSTRMRTISPGARCRMTSP